MGAFVMALLAPLIGWKRLDLKHAVIAGGIALTAIAVVAAGVMIFGLVEDAASGRVTAKIATANETLRAKAEAEAAAARAKEAVYLSKARERVADLEQKLAEQDEDPIVFDAATVESLNQ